jgi:hypothetical protein
VRGDIAFAVAIVLGIIAIWPGGTRHGGR